MNTEKLAKIRSIAEESPAYEVGLYPGCSIRSVDGHPIRDIIDWRWYADDLVACVEYVEPTGEEGSVELQRDDLYDWGIGFEGLIFDDIKLCRNACTFCFMRQLPANMRSTLSTRDDDFRPSFLTGTFVTLTNLSDEDFDRIVEQCISPLRVSLHAITPSVRNRLIGKHHQCGIDNLMRVLDANIEVHAQIVLVPGENDGPELEATLTWAYAHVGIRSIGIVPLGYTKHQSAFTRSFEDASSAKTVLDAIRPFQARALAERGTPWVYAADEFYLSAYGDDVLTHLPDASFYGDYALFEDGIGIVRSCVDDFEQAVKGGSARMCAQVLSDAKVCAHLICGDAMRNYFDALLNTSCLKPHLLPLYVGNDFFGGNVDVTGLLCGCDIVQAIKRCQEDLSQRADGSEQEAFHIYLLPRVVLNDGLVTLDDMSCERIAEMTAAHVCVVSSNPLDCIEEICDLASKFTTPHSSKD